MQLCKVLSASVDQSRRSFTYKTFGQIERQTDKQMIPIYHFKTLSAGYNERLLLSTHNLYYLFGF